MARKLVFLLAWLCGAAPLFANDGVAGLDAGELVFLSTDAVAMEEEELYLSPSEIRVRYLFRNHTDEPVTLMVAFPLPEIRFGDEGDIGFTEAHGDRGNLVNFRTWLDGAPLAVSVHEAAVNDEGRDVTALLRKWQVPVLYMPDEGQDWDALTAHMRGLPGAAREELAAARAVFFEGDWVRPMWSAQVSYFWSVTFPPGDPVELRHAYNPVPEAFIFGRNDLEAGYLDEQACVDEGFRRAGLRMLSGENEYTVARLLNYILTTAGTWAGPIGHFRLIVDKQDPRALVSLCRDGIVKTGPTTFEWEARDWQPEDDLSLLFLAPPG